MGNYCENCGAAMPLTGDCMQCGQRQRENEKHEADHLCAYHEGGRRCPAEGTISKSITGGGRYYCAAHFRHIDNPRMCAAILDDYQENGLPDRTDWRDKLIQEHMNGGHETDDSAAA